MKRESTRDTTTTTTFEEKDDISEISAGCILIKEDEKDRKILLIERFGKGSYEIPKGHFEIYDKDVRMTAERELREETGLINKIKIEEVLGVDGYEVTKKKSKKNADKRRSKDREGRCWKCVVYFRATISDACPVKFDLKTCEEGTTDRRWIGLDELKKIQLRVPKTLSWMIKALKYDKTMNVKQAIETYRKSCIHGDTTMFANILDIASRKRNKTCISMFNRSLILGILSKDGGLDLMLQAGFKFEGESFVMTDHTALVKFMGSFLDSKKDDDE